MALDLRLLIGPSVDASEVGILPRELFELRSQGGEGVVVGTGAVGVRGDPDHELAWGHAPVGFEDRLVVGGAVGASQDVAESVVELQVVPSKPVFLDELRVVDAGRNVAAPGQGGGYGGRGDDEAVPEVLPQHLDDPLHVGGVDDPGIALLDVHVEAVEAVGLQRVPQQRVPLGLGGIEEVAEVADSAAAEGRDDLDLLGSEELHGLPDGLQRGIVQVGSV